MLFKVAVVEVKVVDVDDVFLFGSNNQKSYQLIGGILEYVPEALDDQVPILLIEVLPKSLGHLLEALYGNLGN